MSGSSEATSECSVSIRMVSGDEKAHSSRREYMFDEPSSFEMELLAGSPSEEEVETCLPRQIYRKIILHRI